MSIFDTETIINFLYFWTLFFFLSFFLFFLVPCNCNFICECDKGAENCISDKIRANRISDKLFCKLYH